MGKKSLTLGYLVGKQISGMRRVKKEPIAYLYNGVQLPPLPSRDKETYPYVFMLRWNTGILGGWRIRISAFSKPHHRTVLATDGSTEYQCGVEKGEKYLNSICYEKDVGSSFPNFEEIEATENGVISNEQIWTNYDILNEDGTIYLAASAPIPVYE